MRAFVITLAVFVLAAIVSVAVVVLRTRSYGPLAGITEVMVSDSRGNYLRVSDPATVRKFVAVADDYRFGWRAALGRLYVAEGINISKELVARVSAPDSKYTIQTRDAPKIAHDFFNLIREVADSNPNFQCLDFNQQRS